MDETVPHGEIIHLPDLAKAAGDMHDRSVRTIGRCDDHHRHPPPSPRANMGTPSEGSREPPIHPVPPPHLTIPPPHPTVERIHRLVAYDAAAASATIELDGASIAVDVANVPAPDPHKIGSLYQYIGEVDGRGPDGTPCLRARVARCVDGLDLKLYGRALHERNKFLNIKG